MKNLLLASALAGGLLFVLPVQSRAQYWNSPQCSAGNGWLGNCALKFCPKIHMHGPLYNYGPGPYDGPGYQYQFVNNGLRNGYTPSDPSTYIGVWGNRPTQWESINPALLSGAAQGYGSPVPSYSGQPAPSFQQPYAQGYGMPMQQPYAQGYGTPMMQQQPHYANGPAPMMQQQSYKYPTTPTANQPANAPAKTVENSDVTTAPQASTAQTTSSSRSLRSRLFR